MLVIKRRVFDGSRDSGYTDLFYGRPVATDENRYEFYMLSPYNYKHFIYGFYAKSTALAVYDKIHPTVNLDGQKSMWYLVQLYPVFRNTDVEFIGESGSN